MSRRSFDMLTALALVAAAAGRGPGRAEATAATPGEARARSAPGVVLTAGGTANAQQASAPVGVATVDVVIIDRDGQPVDTIAPADLVVRVDGRPRKVLSIRRVSRGPGAASDAGSRLATADSTMAYAAEPARNVLVVVDQATLARGDERVAVQAAGALLDRLGIEDRVAVLRVPSSADARVTLTAERPEARETLARVVGEGARAGQMAFGRADLPRAEVTVSEPDRVRDPDRSVDAPPPAVAALPDVPTASADADPRAVRTSRAALLGVLQALRPVPGRKLLVLVSAGLVGDGPPRPAELGALAAAAHTTIYAFGLPASRDAQGADANAAALETLARSTGGAFVALGKNPERAVEQMARELAVCYVLGLEPAASDGDGRAHALRVESGRRGTTVRAPAFLVAHADAEDLAPAPPVAPFAAGVRIIPRSEVEKAAKEKAAPAREAELQLALARLFEYAGGYQRQFSALVAEEFYEQTLPRQTVRLRSDVLLIKPDEATGWVSFRDVFEVDGKPVRDREDRLKRLFLEPGSEALARLLAIRDESARYNIGPIERNINVPLYPLLFLTEANRGRFEYKLGHDGTAAGAAVWRVEHVERTRPTLVSDREGHDVPVAGWFLVERMTGAIVETGVRVTDPRFTGEIVVGYRRDGALGLWVPERMRESYRAASGLRWPTTSRPLGGGGASADGWTTSFDGAARYSNFRRFQVKTEEKIAIPK